MQADKLCPTCVHFKRATRKTGFPPGSAHTAGQRRAAMQMMAHHAKLLAMEEQRFRNDYAFDYQPNFFHWCQKATAADDVLEKVREGLLRGDAGPYETAMADGYQFAIDGANGTVERVYVLCGRKNSDNQCQDHKSASETR